MPCPAWRYIVNTTAGGGQGQVVLNRLRELVSSERVGSLIQDGAQAQIEAAQREAVPLVVIGGDGSAASVLDAVARRGGTVPVAVLPLGTGNDLAGFLGMRAWALDHLPQVLAALTGFREQRLDRWLLSGMDQELSWFNYCSFGADARVCHGFDTLRRRHPNLFRGPLINKAWYGLLGLMDRRRSLDGILESPVLRGRRRSFESLVFANISSYAGGTRLRPDIDAADGVLDVVALPGGLPLASYLSHRRTALQLARTRGTWVLLRSPAHLQLDGEPYCCRPGVYRISHAGQVRVLASSPSAHSLPLAEEPLSCPVSVSSC